jgi:hypothetical protein
MDKGMEESKRCSMSIPME